MKPVTILRVAAAIALLQFIGHATLFLTYVPKHGAQEIAVVQAMRDHIFNFSGMQRSYWDMYFGYGLMAAINCLFEAALFWQLAAIAKTSARLVQPVVALFLVANLVYAALVWIYFFPLPSYFDLAIGLCLGMALFAGRIERAVVA